jgi:hypothetical protein
MAALHYFLSEKQFLVRELFKHGVDLIRIGPQEAGHVSRPNDSIRADFCQLRVNLLNGSGEVGMPFS